MAAPEYSQISDEDFNRTLLGNRTTQAAPEVVQDVQVAQPDQGAVKPPTRAANTSSVPNAAAPPSKAGDIDLTGMVNQVTNATTQMQKDMPAPKPADSSQHIMDLVAKHWQIPAAVIGTLATGALLNKFMGGEKASTPSGRIEPSMDVNQQGPKEPQMEGEKQSIKSRSFTPTYSPEDQALLERSEANRIAKEQDAARRAAAAPPTPPSEPPAFIRNQPPVVETPANPKIPALLQAPAGAVAPPAAAPVVVAPVTPPPVVAPPVVETPVTTPAATPAPVPTQAEAPPKKEPKAAKAAVPPVAETEKLTKEQKGMKNHLVSMYGGGVEGEAAYSKVKEILGTTPEFPKGQGGGLSPEQTKVIKDWRKVNIEGPKVNLTHDMKKALKGGAGLSVLLALPGFAEAAQQKDYGKMTDIATDLLVLPFAQSREVGEGEQYELSKRRYEGMVGGGRGIAPPSAYQR